MSTSAFPALKAIDSGDGEAAVQRAIAVDTPPLAYFLDGSPRRFEPVREFLHRARSRRIEIIVSTISEAELLVPAFRTGDERAASAVTALLSGHPAMRIVPVSREVARAAATLSAAHGLSLTDSIVAATAVTEGCSTLVSNDVSFRRLSAGIEYVHLDVV